MVSFAASLKWREGGQGNKRRYVRACFTGIVEDDFIRSAQNALHSFNVKAFARQGWRIFILFINLIKTSRLAARISHSLLALGFSLLKNARRSAAAHRGF